MANSNPDVEIIIIAFNELGKAREVFNKVQKAQDDKTLQIITAAALEKDKAGKTSTVATLDVARKKGTRYGALAGGLLAIIAPPIGAAGVLIGVVGGAVVGRKVKKKPTQNFTEEFLREVLGQMHGDSSALVVLVDSESADQFQAEFEEYGGKLFRKTLSEEAVDQLAKSEDKDKQQTTGEEKPEPVELPEDFKTMMKEGTKRQSPEINKVFVIVNPASGQDATILNSLNSVFHAAHVDWDIAITKKSGDAARLAREAAEAGEVDIVAVYGGDGTVMETASGLMGTDMPLGILPGGTNNVLSVELGIPKDLVSAAALIATEPAKFRTVDMGKANGQLFILRVGIGYEAQINELADREMKDRYGGLAYTLAGLKALKKPPIARYRLTLDGKVEELEGLWCMVANSASLGIPNVGIAEGVDVGDGLLDVIVVRQRDLESLLSVAGSITKKERIGKPLPHWKVKEVYIEADPPMAVDGDGELWEPTPLQASVIPQAVRILVPEKGGNNE